jgi:hypothetical protein
LRRSGIANQYTNTHIDANSYQNANPNSHANQDADCYIAS